jgi:Type I restriction enzyme R protein N terminus (HSDR_N)
MSVSLRKEVVTVKFRQKILNFVTVNFCINLFFIQKVQSHLSFLPRMFPLNLPPFDYQLRKQQQKIQIFDVLRKKWLVLTPEEWVRQHVVHHLLGLGYPPALISLEAPLQYHGLAKRSDILVFDRQGQPFLLVECKAPHVEVSENVFRQALAYNHVWQAPHLVLSNGLSHLIGQVQAQPLGILWRSEWPLFEE